jgi:hypothetical protein
MICKKCGAPIEDGKNFCGNCGESVVVEEIYVQNTPVQSGYSAPKKQVVTAGGYILRSLINYIPAVGPLIYFIMLFVWNADSKKEESFRNWAKAQLILYIIALAIVLLAAVVFLVIVLLFTPAAAGATEVAIAEPSIIY